MSPGHKSYLRRRRHMHVNGGREKSRNVSKPDMIRITRDNGQTGRMETGMETGRRMAAGEAIESRSVSRSNPQAVTAVLRKRLGNREKSAPLHVGYSSYSEALSQPSRFKRAAGLLDVELEISPVISLVVSVGANAGPESSTGMSSTGSTITSSVIDTSSSSTDVSASTTNAPSSSSFTSSLDSTSFTSVSSSTTVTSSNLTSITSSTTFSASSASTSSSSSTTFTSLSSSSSSPVSISSSMRPSFPYTTPASSISTSSRSLAMITTSSSSSSRTTITLTPFSSSNSSPSSTLTFTSSSSRTVSLKHTASPSPSLSSSSTETSPSPSSLVPSSASSSRFATNDGAIIGITIASTVALIGCAFVVFLLCARIRNRSRRGRLRDGDAASSLDADAGGSGAAAASEREKEGTVDPSVSASAGTGKSKTTSKSRTRFGIARGISGSSGSTTRRPMLSRNLSTASSTARAWRSPLSDEDDDIGVAVSPDFAPGYGYGSGYGYGYGSAYAGSGSGSGNGSGSGTSSSGHGHGSSSSGHGHGFTVGYASGSAESSNSHSAPYHHYPLHTVGLPVAGPSSFGQAVETMHMGSAPPPPVPPPPPLSYPPPPLSPPAVIPPPSLLAHSSLQDHDHDPPSSPTWSNHEHDHDPDYGQDRLYRTATASTLAQPNTNTSAYASTTAHGSSSNSHSNSHSSGVHAGSSTGDSLTDPALLSSSSPSPTISAPPTSWTSTKIPIPKLRLNDQSPPPSRPPSRPPSMRSINPLRGGLIARLRGGRGSAQGNSGDGGSTSFFSSLGTGTGTRTETPPPSALYYPTLPNRTSLLNPPLPVFSPLGTGIGIDEHHALEPPPSNAYLGVPSSLGSAPAPVDDDSNSRMEDYQWNYADGLLTGNVHGVNADEAGTNANTSAYSLSDNVDYSRPFRGFVFNRMDSSTTVTTTSDTRTTMTRTPAVETPALFEASLDVPAAQIQDDPHVPGEDQGQEKQGYFSPR
ncbi:hypothetical protein GYMLUDRAFT_74883 [Collybiopsis luxurians FD-317 M1]|uniref:Uncharacterized protein n=1 Tax=Collybiopsis luxurians FD-317 M1 TaxID=944289 RepID=A0A0D0C826_9AGAR|nr:hypothetical protein GYMLUDRAFT_74883 [Collybiopsis luxurians FD-317 M1]